MNSINFSKSYHVRMLIERDIPLVLALCKKNTQFYEHCPPFVTEESIRDDMCALPQRKMDEPQDKYYLGFLMMPSSLWLGWTLLTIIQRNKAASSDSL